jgi:FkbM family methyltransferase
VFAFEPQPDAFELLVSNARHCAYENVTLFNAAVSDHCRMAGLGVPDRVAGPDGHFFARIVDQAAAGQAQQSVFCCCIDALRFDRPIRLAKIDVEGHELPVLRGMRALLSRDKPALIVETDSPATADYLRQFGYVPRRIDGSSNTIFTIPPGT